MGQPIDFEGSNLVMRAPEGAENVQNMHVYRTRHSCVSCWTVTPDELAEITMTGRIFLSVLAGGQQPPVYVGSESTCREVMIDFGPVWPMPPRTPSPVPQMKVEPGRGPALSGLLESSEDLQSKGSNADNVCDGKLTHSDDKRDCHGSLLVRDSGNDQIEGNLSVRSKHGPGHERTDLRVSERYQSDDASKAKLAADEPSDEQYINSGEAFNAPPADNVEGTFQSRVQPWMMACFGEMISGNREERNHRFLEEALELVQSTGCTAHEAHQLVDYVYGRDTGEPHQEVGGVMVTLAALCLANALDMHQCGETELERIWKKVDAIRAKQAAKPKHSPLPGPSAEESK
ncbi:hypothetical protein [Neorhizobium sp. DAR64872/K0K18]|uniref:hypothetical protein n=1 Tax=Neorhizobium sp. DAR64872/K0K18 TaxID=3421958 RepID=UPI003D2A905D